MLRLLLRLLGIKDFDTCKSCETLKDQLEFERSNNKELTETLISIIKPKIVEAAPVEINPIPISGGSFARRRAAMEEKDRQEAKVLAEAKHIGKPDNLITVAKGSELEALEKELGLEETKEA